MATRAGASAGLVIPLTVPKEISFLMPYTNISKPTGAGYTNIAKPSDAGGNYQIKAGMITGILIPLTYATTHTAPTGAGYTTVSKPTT